MTIEQFTAAIRSEPFRPFVVHTADGKEYQVNHPELASRTPAGRTIVVTSGENAVAVLDLLLVTAITYQNAAASPAHGSDR
jgi:hypothetical protein